MYSGTDRSYRMPSCPWYWFIPSGSTFGWYVVGEGNDGEQISHVEHCFSKE